MLIIELIQVNIKPTTSNYSVTQQCQMHWTFAFYPFYCSLKEKEHMRRITNSKKRNIYLWNQYDYYSDLPKLGSPRPGHQKIKLRSPNRRCNFYVAVGLQLCDYFCKTALTLSWRRPLSYRSQSIDLLRKSMDWFLYDNDNGLRHERVNKK